MRRLSSFLRFNTLLRATACCILLSASIVSASGQDSVRRFNVVMIIVDDLNDWVGPLGGYPGIKTPNIDRLARQGLTFRKAYCSAPACNPSRTSLLTGIRPSTSGVYHNKQPWRPVIPEALTLPEHFDRS